MYLFLFFCTQFLKSFFYIFLAFFVFFGFWKGEKVAWSLFSWDAVLALSIVPLLDAALKTVKKVIQ